MDDYLMTTGTTNECFKFINLLEKVRTDQGQHKECDMDDVISMHDKYLTRILQLCLLDSRSEELKRYIIEIVEISQEFRVIIKHYLLCDEDDALSVDSDIHEAPKFEGMGKLKYNSQTFSQDHADIVGKLNLLRDKFER